MRCRFSLILTVALGNGIPQCIDWGLFRFGSFYVFLCTWITVSQPAISEEACVNVALYMITCRLPLLCFLSPAPPIYRSGVTSMQTLIPWASLWPKLIQWKSFSPTTILVRQWALWCCLDCVKHSFYSCSHSFVGTMCWAFFAEPLSSLVLVFILFILQLATGHCVQGFAIYHSLFEVAIHLNLFF